MTQTYDSDKEFKKYRVAAMEHSDHSPEDFDSKAELEAHIQEHMRSGMKPHNHGKKQSGKGAPKMKAGAFGRFVQSTGLNLVGPQGGRRYK